jgi:hypothetical protein
LIVAIAAMNIISGLVMLVTNKGRDIAILRTMGAGQGAICAHWQRHIPRQLSVAPRITEQQPL